MDLSKFSLGSFTKFFSFFVVFTLFAVAIVSADEIILPFNKDGSIVRPCFNNGTFCSTSAVCNLTVSYPAGRILINNQIMTNQGSFHNYTIIASDINTLGEYHSVMMCTDSGGDISGSAPDTFTILVTGDGLESSPFPVQLSILILGLVGIGVGAWNRDLKMFKMIGSILVMAIGVITLYPGYSGLNFSNIQGLGLGLVSLGIGFYFLIDDAFSKEQQAERFEVVEEDGRFDE